MTKHPTGSGSLCRRFNGAKVERLIVSVLAATVAQVDSLLNDGRRRHAARGCRAEFVRLAISEKLARDMAPSKAPVCEETT